MRIVAVWVVVALTMLLISGQSRAEQPAASAGWTVADRAGQELLRDKLARLEALVEQQQRQIEVLQRQVSESSDRLEAARVEQVKDLLRQVMRDSEFRESLFPQTVQIGYEKGFYVRSADEQFELKINGGVQFRWSFYNDQSRNRSVAPRRTFSDRNGFEFERVDVVFSGHVFGPDLTYLIRVRSDTDDQHQWRNYYAWVDYRFCEGFHARAGVFKLPFGLQETLSEWEQMFADRGMVNEVFNLDRSIGLQFWGELLKKKLTYYVAVTNGWADGHDRFGQSDVVRELDQNPAFTARVVWHALGDVGPGESDLQYHQDPALNVGLSFGYMDDNGDLHDPGIVYAIPDFFRAGAGGFGVTNMWGTDVTQFGADAHFKWRGLAATWEYWLRMVNVSNAGLTGLVAPYFLATGSDDTFHQQGMQVQVGYFIIPKRLEAAVRVGGVWDIGPGSEGVWEYAGGVNYYLKGHNWKLTADVTKINELPAQSRPANFIDLNDDLTLFRLQMQVMF